MNRDLDPHCCGFATSADHQISKPTDAEIARAVQEAYDRLWYVRNIALGRPAAGEESALLLETKYGPASLTMCDACELRMEGRLGALRWALHGSAIDNYDT